jgi:uncharacterized protein (TIGR00251 family)
LDLKVQPRASRDRIVGPLGERLKISITAPPVDGKANSHLCRFLAKAFAVPNSRVTVVGGLSSRDKRLRIDAPRRIPEALAEFLTLPGRARQPGC